MSSSKTNCSNNRELTFYSFIFKKTKHMEICFQSISSTVNFENWLKSFKEINDSLLMEIDTTQKLFIAKTYTNDKTIVKYGKLDFDAAALEVVSVTGKDRKKVTLDEWNTANTARIKVGIYQILDKFIKVINRFGSTDNYKIVIKFDQNTDGDFVAQRIEFKSLTLNMAASAAELTEFKYITDEQFLNGIAKIENPLYFGINADTSKALVDISNIFSADAKKDIIDFRIKKESGEWTLHAIDYNGQSYDYQIGYLDQNRTDEATEVTDDVHIPVVRQNFILGTKSDGENGCIVISANEDGGGKVAVHSGENFITIIASVRV